MLERRPLQKKLKGRPIFTLRQAETGGFEVLVDSRVADTERHTYHFDAEAQAHAWIRENLTRFAA